MMNLKRYVLFVVALVLVSVVTASEFGDGSKGFASRAKDAVLDPGLVVALFSSPDRPEGPSVFARIVQSIPGLGRFVRVERVLTIEYGTPVYDLPGNYNAGTALALKVPVTTNAKLGYVTTPAGKVSYAFASGESTEVTLTTTLTKTSSGYTLSAPLSFELAGQVQE